MNAKKRYFGMDVARVLALILLLWLHFFLRNGFYSQPVDDIPMTLAAAGRCVFMCCIPMFLLLTGYLKCGKEWRKGYYNGLLPVMISWVIVSMICLWYKIEVAGQTKTVWQWLAEFLDFKLANYSWYLEMYIGLLLISPFLNMAWNHMETRRQHQGMVATFVVLTFLPSTVNGISPDGETLLNLIPNYWSSLYFFTYYLIGCYLRTYQPKPKVWRVLVIAASAALFLGILNRYTGGAEGDFYEGFNVPYSHLGTAVISVCLFLAVYRLECRNERIAGLMGMISGVTLEMYLVSCVFDQKIYVIDRGMYGAEQYWWRGPLYTGAVFVLSLAAGWCIHQVSARLSAWILSGRDKNAAEEVKEQPEEQILRKTT